MSLIEHLEKLRHFYKLTSYKSINEGAQGMGISQAGLSKSIANLESVLETSLFNRSNEGLTLTKEGELVLQATKKILSEANNLETNLRSLKAAQIPESIAMGMYDSIAVYFFEELETYLGSVYPEVKLNLVVDKSSRLSELVEQKDLDIAIGVNLKEKNSATQFFPLFEDHFSFYVSPHFKKSTSDLPLLIHPDAEDQVGQSNSEYIQRVVKNRRLHQVYNFETLKALTIQGMGIGVLPTQVAKPLVRQKQLVSFEMTKTKQIFGSHQFATDVMRLGDRWSRS